MRAQHLATARVRVSCDSIVALAPLTGGHSIFAKNSDRPADECQSLLQVAAADHARGSELGCQYISIDQVERTHAFIGSRPYWLWGLEHGVNEYGVAIGNHTIFTKDPVADVGLLGMDLVRLGLERAATATAAVDVIVTLIERHGQGGSGYADTIWPYHNSFLIADGRQAFLLEASARNWALRSIERGASASNHVTIGADWDRLSTSCVSHARAENWWNAEARIDFAAAYRDTSLAPAIVSSARHGATCAVLARPGPLGFESFQRVMRDHNGSELYGAGLAPDDERYYSVCMHADPVGTTTASMIVELDGSNGVGPVWVAFCNPCISPYVPVFLDGRVPPELERGGKDADAGGAWWRFKRLLTLVEKDWMRNAPIVRDCWRAHERGLRKSTADLMASRGLDNPERRAATLTGYMQRVWDETLVRADALEAELAAR
jgi:secernin